MAAANLVWRADVAGAIASTEALKRVVASVGGSSTTGAIGKLAASWRILVPAIAGAGVAVLAVTGNLAALAPLIPLLTIALTGLLAPFTTLAAMLVGFIPPLTLLVSLLGGLGIAFGLAGARAIQGGGKFAAFGKFVSNLAGEFHGLVRVLAQDFMPIFWKLATAAQSALMYLTKIAHLPLKQAFQSLSTTGVKGFQKFLDMVGGIVAKPIRLAFGVAFGKSDTLRKALVDDWNDIMKFFFGKHGVALPVEKWFRKQDFTAVGYRWASELAGATMSVLGAAFMKLLSSQGGKFMLGGTGIGFAIGTAISPGIGSAIGATIGLATGIILNHYWPKITKAGVNAFRAVGQAAKRVLGGTLWNEIISLTKSFWDTLKAIGGFLKHDVYPVVKRVWGAIGGWHTVLVAVSTVIRVIVGVFVVVAATVRIVYNLLKRVWDAVSGAARAVAGGFASAWGAVKSAAGAVLGIVGSIVSGIQTAVGWAQSLANALAGSGGVPGGTQKGPGGGVINRRPRGGNPHQNQAPTGNTTVLHVHVHGGTFIGTMPHKAGKDLAAVIQPHLDRAAARRR